MRSKTAGFTLIELVAVLIIAGTLAAVVLSRSMPASTLQLQAAKDTLLLTLLSAQQQALVSDRPVQVIASDHALDMRQDINNDGRLSQSESVRAGGLQYPISIKGVRFKRGALRYYPNGFSDGGELVMVKGEREVTVRLSEGGYAH